MKAFQLLELFLKTLMLPSDTLYAQYNSKGHFVPHNGHRSMVHMAAGELAEILPVEILSKAHNALFSCAPFPRCSPLGFFEEKQQQQRWG